MSPEPVPTVAAHHRAKRRAYWQRYYAKHRAEIQARVRRYHREHARDIEARRRAQRKAGERRITFMIPRGAYKRAQRLAIAKRMTVRRLAEELLACYVAEHARR